MDDKIEQSYLYKKIDSIEHRLESHVTKIEQRLDQLVHLMSAVAQLQERESRNAEGIKEVKGTLKESFEVMQKAIERLHLRLDNIEDSQNEEVARCETRGSKVGSQVRTIEAEVAKWRDRGIGLWLGLSLLVFVIQGYGGMVLNSYIEDHKQTKVIITEVTRKQIELTQEISRLTSQVYPHPEKGVK